ncbi:U-box domain-containing protein 44 [Dichanthelium oligosanthes]|uniref:RING-type E3 ubiquitin transferase n=1 Tax=Dichanthelium oligosanthes TaxID=888268 RepID=A0A1E5V9G7_9POAL|nr:U-box domain-containing protein 44 [Dichanthelium oligosanthes]
MAAAAAAAAAAHDSGGDSELEDQSNQEPAFDAFMCPLTKQVMHDPVTIETGQTFEREAILKWFRECRDSGRKPTCPLTQTELRTTDMSPSIALRNVIDEWRARNQDKELEKACATLSQQQPHSEDDDAMRALVYISQTCHRSGASKNLVRRQGIIPAIAGMLKSGSRRVRLKSLEVLGVVVEDNDENKVGGLPESAYPRKKKEESITVVDSAMQMQEELGKGDTIRTIIKFLSNDHVQERELAVSLLYELSKLDPICQRIGAVYGAILLLVGMGSSKSENLAAVEKAENTLKNLEKYETNVKQMAENGRLQPLLTKLIEGTPQVQVAMAEYLGELALANDIKAVVAEQVGALLVSIMKTGSLPAREATLKALREISSNESSAKILLQAGILPPLVTDLLSVGAGHLPMRLKEVSAAILANLVASGADFRSIPLDAESGETLLSEDVVHSLLHLISNTGPAIECKLLNVLVGLTGSPATVADVVSAIRSSGATISLIQFVEAAHREIRVESLKLLRNVSPYMGAELADALGGSAGHLGSLLRVVSDDRSGVTEEQAAAAGLLGDLPERDWNLTRQLQELGAFRALASKLVELRRGTIRGNRHVARFTEGAVKVLYRVTCALQEEAEAEVEVARELGLAPLFVELLQQQMSGGLDAVLLYSAMALENLSLQSRVLTAVPEPPQAARGGLLVMCACFGGGQQQPPPQAPGTCRVHGGFCSLRETFCLAEVGCKAVERLVACLEHADARVVEAALAALSTLVGDGVANATEGVLVVGEAEGLRPVVDVLVENRTEALQRRAVWAVERILRVEDIAQEVAADQTVASALVEAYRNGDARTRQTAERALRHLDRIPNFSTAFHHAKGNPPPAKDRP